MATGRHEKRSAQRHATLLTTDLIDAQRKGQPVAGQIGTGSIIGTDAVYATQAAARSAFGLGTIATQAANAVAITGGSISGLTTFTGLVTERTLAVAAPGDVVIPVFVAARGYTINAVTIYTLSGTVTVACKIGTTDVTSLSALSVSATPQTVAATAANAMVAGNTLNISCSSGSTPLDLHVTVKLTLA